jgi:gliding motility-associated-like protein
MKTIATIFFCLLLLLYENGYSQITITFTVDVAGMTIGTGGMHIAGQFETDSSLTILSDWNPGAPGSQMTLVSGTTYTVDVQFPFSAAGKPLEFEFVRDDVWTNSTGDVSEGNPGDCCLDLSCGVEDGSGGINRMIIIPDCSGTYSCTWNNCAQLIASLSPAITVTPMNPLICKGESIQLSATSLASVSWSPDPTLSCTLCNNPIATPDTTTYYYVTASIGNCMVIETILVSVAVPVVNLSNNQMLCEGESVQLSADGTGTISWSPASGLSCTSCNDPVASPASSTLYFATATVGGCSLTDSLLITVDDLSINAGPDQNINFGESIQLNAEGASAYLWQPPDGLSCTECNSPIASPTVTTQYVVTSISDNGCKASDSVSVFITVPCKGIYFPNAFTPNGDGRNDTFGAISELDIPINTFKIYNRWGQLVFESNTFNGQWDGSFQKQPQPIEAYIYYLELSCEGKNVLLKGAVMLIR